MHLNEFEPPHDKCKATGRALKQLGKSTVQGKNAVTRQQTRYNLGVVVVRPPLSGE